MSFEKVTTQDGLNSNRVFMTLEDKQGFMWIATDKGVDRFDGKNIKNYTLERIDEIIGSKYLRLFLAQDSRGKIWVLSNQGILLYYDEGKDVFVYHDHIKPNPKSNAIYAFTFYIDQRDQFLIGSIQGLLNYHPEDTSFSKLPKIRGHIYSITQDNEQNYYFGGDKGVFLFDPKLKFQKNLKEELKNLNLENVRIGSLFIQESMSRLWIGTNSQGLYYYNLENQSFQKAKNGLEDLNVAVHSICPYKDKQLLLACDGRGVVVWDLLKMRVSAEYAHDIDKPNTLSSSGVLDINLNTQGVIFVSTYRGGLNIHNPYRQEFHLLQHILGQSNSLDNNLVLSLLEPQKGLISFGTDKGLSQWNKKTQEWKHFNFNESEKETRSPAILAQQMDQQGNIWLGSYNASIIKLINNGEGYVFDQNIEERLRHFRIKSLLYHSSGILLFGANFQNLWSYQPEDGSLKKYDISHPQCLIEYSPTKVLMSNANRIAILDLTQGKIIPINHKNLKDTFEKNPAASAFIDNDQQVWLTTRANGIFKCDFNTGQLKHYSTKNGLASNRVFSVVVDSKGDTWLATASGISRIKEETIENFYVSDGIATTDFNNNAALVDSDGTVYFGTNQGVVYFSPENIRLAQLKKRLVFTDLYLNYQRVGVGGDSPLKKPLNQSKAISFAYDQRSFSIAFTTVDFSNTGGGIYQWKLEGFDDYWLSESGLQRASYTKLAPGTYTFRLRLLDPTGKVLGEERKILIHIRPPFWLSTFAYFLYFLLIILLIIGLLYLNRLVLNSKNAKEQLRLLMSMAHEIKTPLTLIRAPLNDLFSNHQFDKQVQESLGVALSNSERLHKQMMQLLDFRRVSALKENLLIERFDLITAIQEKIFAFQLLADRKHIAVDFEPPQAQFEINNDPKVLDKVITNVLSNAIKYTPEEGQIQLILEISEKNWALLVKDTGIGIPKKDQKKIFKLFYRTQNARQSGSTGSGVGLILAKDLAKTLGGDLSLLSSSQKGSVFKIYMPLLPEDLITEKNMEVEGELIANSDKNEQTNIKISVLLVEDDDELRAYEKGKLRQAYHVTEARNGQEAIEVMAKDLPDFVISDVSMPKMSGLQLCMNIKSNVQTSHIPVILLTGMGEKEQVIQGLESGADDYITKPFDFDLLITKINNLLNSRKVLKEKFMGEDTELVDYDAIKNEKDQQFVKNLTQLVEENMSDPELSIDFLCSTIGMSRSTFYHKLKSLLGSTPNNFIKSTRLKEAKKLLQNPSYNISEVAYSTGFMDAKYFSTVFKRHYGLSPSTYIAELEKKRNKPS